jgi:hypothetical protein
MVAHDSRLELELNPDARSGWGRFRSLHHDWPFDHDGTLHNHRPFDNHRLLHHRLLHHHGSFHHHRLFDNHRSLPIAMWMVILMMVVVSMMFVVPMSAFALPRIGRSEAGTQRHEHGKESDTESLWPSHSVIPYE